MHWSDSAKNQTVFLINTNTYKPELLAILHMPREQLKSHDTIIDKDRRRRTKEKL